MRFYVFTLTCIVLVITVRYMREYELSGLLPMIRNGPKDASLYRKGDDIRTLYAPNSGNVRKKTPGMNQMCVDSHDQIYANISRTIVISPKKNYSENSLIQRYKVQIQERVVSGRILIENIRCFFVQTRGRIVKFYQQSLPNPHGDLAFWVVFGYESTSSSSLIVALRQLGVSDMIVASGYQVSFFSSLLMIVFSKKKSTSHVIFRLFFLWCYALIVGFQASILRSALSRTFLELSRYLGRQSQPGWALFLSGALMLIIKPDYLFSLGFQFSFIISFGFIIFSSREQYTISSIMTPIFAWFISLPIEFFHDNPVFLSSIFAELALLWICPALMTSSVLFFFLLWIPGIQNIAKLSVYMCTSVYLEITRVIQQVFQSTPLEIKPSIFVYFLWFTAFSFMLFRRFFQRKTRKYQYFSPD